jgi:hypothetical protein
MILLRLPSPTWNLEMDQFATNVLSDLDIDIEVIPPERDGGQFGNAIIGLCGQKKRSASRMDADGRCNCDECLAQ